MDILQPFLKKTSDLTIHESAKCEPKLISVKVGLLEQLIHPELKK